MQKRSGRRKYRSQHQPSPALLSTLTPSSARLPPAPCRTPHTSAPPSPDSWTSTYNPQLPVPTLKQSDLDPPPGGASISPLPPVSCLLNKTPHNQTLPPPRLITPSPLPSPVPIRPLSVVRRLSVLLLVLSQTYSFTYSPETLMPSSNFSGSGFMSSQATTIPLKTKPSRVFSLFVISFLPYTPNRAPPSPVHTTQPATLIPLF